jgi:hypothetical protein
MTNFPSAEYHMPGKQGATKSVLQKWWIPSNPFFVFLLFALADRPFCAAGDLLLTENKTY